MKLRSLCICLILACFTWSCSAEDTESESDGGDESEEGAQDSNADEENDSNAGEDDDGNEDEAESEDGDDDASEESEGGDDDSENDDSASDDESETEDEASDSDEGSSESDEGDSSGEDEASDDSSEPSDGSDSEEGTEEDTESNTDENAGSDTSSDDAQDTDTTVESELSSDSENSTDVTEQGDLFTVSHLLASDEDARAPGTVGIVTWSVDLETPDVATIEFGLDTNYGMSAPVDLNETDFRTLLLGMKPSSSYHFRVVVEVAGTVYASDDYVIDTGAPSDVVGLGEFDVRDDNAREKGFIVMSYWGGGGGGGGDSSMTVPFIIDSDGDIVWWFSSSTSSIARARMSEDGKNMWMLISGLQGGPIERVRMDTLEGQTYATTMGSHDLTPVSGELMAYLDYGEDDCDSIVEITPSGDTEEVFESDDFMSGGGGGGGMGCHSNALRYSLAEDVYTFSDLNQDVLIVNRTGGVDWRLSERVTGGNDTWGGAQHGHHLLDNSIVIFANSSTEGNGSALVEYDLDGNEIFRYDSESNYASGNLGDVQRLPGGNSLITYSNAGIIQEIDSQGNVLLQVSAEGNVRIGYTVWRPTLYGPPPDIGM